tara:strand:+ start:6271 stop:7323 length:1053 start_codon:yes stop_codon:yes gene_type:complete
MPIPKPKSSESRQQFLDRCMGDKTMVDEYSDSGQRSAVCNSSYNSYKEDSLEGKRQLRRDVFTTEEEASERAKEIGCSGTHSHDENGNLVYMPCKTHAEYTELTGREVSGYGKKPKKKKPKDMKDALENLEQVIQVQSDIKAYYEDEDEEDKDYGTFEGYGSVFGNKDLGNDVIKEGAFMQTLKRKKPHQIKLLYQHKTDMPIGVFDEIREDSKGLYVKGRLALQTQAGKEAYELMKMGALDGLSIGFRVNPKEVEYDRRANKRIIKEAELMEVSLVTFPMNPKATIHSVKGEDISIREWENGLRDAFNLSRSEAKVGAKAVTEAFHQREVGTSAELVDAIKQLTLTLKS